MRDISKNKKIIMSIGIILLLIIITNNSIITRGKLAEYKTLDKKIQELEEIDLNYYENNREEISKYLDLKKKYELPCEFELDISCSFFAFDAFSSFNLCSKFIASL